MNQLSVALSSAMVLTPPLGRILVPSGTQAPTNVLEFQRAGIVHTCPVRFGRCGKSPTARCTAAYESCALN